MVLELVKPQKQEKSEKLITGKELLAMGDSGPSELIDRRVVSMSPTKVNHGRFEYRIARLIGEFVEANQLGEVMVAGARCGASYAIILRLAYKLY